MKEILEKIKPWIKTKVAWLEIALSLLAIVCFILGVVKAGEGSRKQDAERIAINAETEDSSAKPTTMPEDGPTPESTDKPESTFTPKPTNAPAATPKATVAAENKVTPEPGPTGAPLYTPVPEESVSSKDKAYRTLVESSSFSKSYSRYYIYDMDRDGVEELIMHVGTDDLDSYINIYTYTDDGLIFVGDASGSFAEIYGSTKEGIIVYYRREINGQKHESIERRMKVDEDCFMSTVVVQAKVSEYTVLEDEEEITAYSLDDLSPFE